MKLYNTSRFDCSDYTSSGIRHACRRCGDCCRGQGRVRLLEGEIERIAGFLRMDVHMAAAYHTMVADDRTGLVLTDKNNGDCTFLEDAGTCRIHGVKPRQCRAYPAAWRNPGETTECAGGVSFDRTERVK